MTFPTNLRYRFFGGLARLDVDSPWTVLFVTILLAVVCVFYTKSRLEFRTGQDDLISTNTRDSRNYLRYTHEFPGLDGLIVVVKTAPSKTRAELFADTLARQLEADHINVSTVFYRLDPSVVGNRGLLYLSVDDLNDLASKLDPNLPMLGAYAINPSLAAIFGIANRQIDNAIATAMRERAGSTAHHKKHAAETKDSEQAPAAFASGFLDATLTGMLADPATNPPPPWATLAGLGSDSRGMHDGYLMSDNGKYLLLQIAPGDGVAHGPDPVDVIQGMVDRTRAQFPDVSAGMTGGPALAHAEETTTQHDMMIGSVIAVTGLVLLMVIPFRGVVEPLFAIIALLVGVAWSFGFTTLAVGHLNLLSAVFTSVLAGIGINFPIHLMARYDEARRRGRGVRECVQLAVVNTGTGVFASACIMALAFLMPMFTDFKGIAELGLVSAAGLFCCLASALLVFPALIVLRDRDRPLVAKPIVSLAPARSMLEKLFGRPAIIVGLALAATLGAVFLARGVGFDQDLLKLQASDAEAVRFEKTLLRDSGRSSWFAVALAPTRKLAEREADRFRKLPEVSDVETIGTYIPDRQDEKMLILAHLNAELQPITVRPAQPEIPAALMRELKELDTKLDMIAPYDPSGGIGKTASLASQAIFRLHADPAAFSAYSRHIADNLGEQLTAFKAQLNGGGITEANLPSVLRERFIGASGAYLVQIYPKGDVWEDAPLQRFIDGLRSIDRDVTGPPVQTYAIATVMRKGYERAAILALIAVFVFVFADFRNLRDTLLATVPLIFGAAWLLETMGALRWNFNLANLFAVPILIGMGVDNGVNMLYRWREERDKSSLILTKAVGKSVTICSLTTIAAFAALIPANHRGISSMGWVLTLGTSFILLATLIVLPALFELLGSRIQHAQDSDSHSGTASLRSVSREDPRSPRKIASSKRG